MAVVLAEALAFRHQSFDLEKQVIIILVESLLLLVMGLREVTMV
jgi:hypothetical protein